MSVMNVEVANDLSEVIALRTAALPSVLWIELTSRCPFDCVFCSRKLLRGAGMHMPWAMFQRLMAELRKPTIIRLNYSGESVHYPHLIEACQLAAQHGAEVELVTALAALPEHKVDALVRCGLTRLTVSLHTLDHAAFQDIYRFGTLDALTSRLRRIVQLMRDEPDAPLRSIDLAFVAMRRNLSQLTDIVAYADRLGIDRVAVHPVIRRDAIAETFDAELDRDRLRPEFLLELERTVSQVGKAYPNVRLECSTPETAEPTALTCSPAYFPGALPQNGVRISGCDQDPFETVHILADGRVVSCEVRDQIELGNFNEKSLSEIWHGEAYRTFRAQHLAAIDPQCRTCPYKRAHILASPVSSVRPGVNGHQALVAGWYLDEHARCAWSAPQALLHLRSMRHGGILRVRGLLPDGGNRRNALTLSISGMEQARIESADVGMREFDIKVALRSMSVALTSIRFDVEIPYCPSRRGVNEDTRRLGFALFEAGWVQ